MTDVAQLDLLERRLHEAGSEHGATLMPLVGKKPVKPWKEWPAGHKELGAEGTALITGHRSGVFVVDCDSQGAMEQFLSQYPDMNTLVVQTKRGFHFYFKLPGGGMVVRNSSGTLFPHIDVRGEGGYVAAPGSPDKTIVVDVPISDAPAELLNDVTKHTSPQNSVQTTKAPGLADAIEFLSHCPVIIGGSGHAEPEMLRVCGHLKHLGWAEDQITQLILQHYNGPEQTRDSDGNHFPWTEAEIQHKAHDATAAPYPPPRGGDTSVLDGLRKKETVLVTTSLAQRIREWTNKSVVRIPTGFQSLDEALRGGMYMGRLAIIGGAPGAAKTATALSIALPMAQAGHCVRFLASDESWEGLVTRAGQMQGLSREAIERGDPEARETLAKFAEGIDFNILDNSMLEEACGQLTKPTVVVIDSIQTQYLEAAEGIRDRYEQINVLMKALKLMTREGHMVIATCEIARSHYTAKEDIDPLGAFKETGAIEYAADLALLLRSRKGTSNIIDVQTAKNRLGTCLKPTFTLCVDLECSLVTELRTASAIILGPKDKRKKEILDFLREHPQLDNVTRATLLEGIGGGKPILIQAINELLEERQLTQDMKGRISLPHEVLTQLSP